ncbi:MAG: RNA-binding domain-containing protein, partial [Flavobacteriales bacterium]
MDELSRVLHRLEACIRAGSYETVEATAYEVKPVPADGHSWHKIHQAVCGFLNTKGGIIILGIKEEQVPLRKFTFQGYEERYSENLKRIRDQYKDKQGGEVDLNEYVKVESQPFMEGQIAMVRVGALPDDRKFVFYAGKAYRRSRDGTEEIGQRDVERQEERKEELRTARELDVIDGASVTDLSLNRLNEYIQALNRGGVIESLKPGLVEAKAFLLKKRFITPDDAVTTLGMLVCGEDPQRWLMSRAQMDCFLEAPSTIAEDKKTFVDNVLQLLEQGVAWTFRSIQTGVQAEAGGTRTYEYPEKLVRESVNNALAHRDYSILRPVQITAKNRRHLAIRNPGRFPRDLVVSVDDPRMPVRRIFANPKAVNPRLADALRVFDKWEGKGNGMADLTNYAMRNAIDVPYYLSHS